MYKYNDRLFLTAFSTMLLIEIILKGGSNMLLYYPARYKNGD